MFAAFISWVDQMKVQLPAMSGAARHGCCSSIALVTGLLLCNMDMILSIQHGLGPDGNVPEYIVATALPMSISLDYLLPKCDEIREVLQKVQQPRNGAGTSMSTMHSQNLTPEQSVI